MKVIAWFTDGSFYEVEVSEAELGKHCGPQEAIAKAKEKSVRSCSVKTWATLKAGKCKKILCDRGVPGGASRGDRESS